MKSTKYFLIILVLLLSAATLLNAQEKKPTKLGIQLNALYPINEWSGFDRFSYLARGLARFHFSNHFGLEVGAGFGEYKGLDDSPLEWYYGTTIIPVDLRLILYPFANEGFNPYLYAGGGLLFFSNNVRHGRTSPVAVKESGTTGIIPVGIGFEIPLSRTLDLELTAGYTHTFSDDLNYYAEDDAKDAYFNFGVTLAFNLAGDPDRDKDGLKNEEEEKIGTNPDNADTDGDGLSDGDEVMNYKTDPLKADSDDDMLSDKDELMTHKTNPVNADTDGDGLKDGEEVMTYKTDPLNKDTDGDGLTDGDEVMKYKTDPLKKDTDGEGLTDGDEVMKYKTNPLKKDTDEGSVDDFKEVNRGTNPLDPEDDVIIEDVSAPIILEGITFEFNKAEIRPESEETLNLVLRTLKAYPDMQIEIQGFTDNVGKESVNKRISQMRADAVVEWLVGKEIDPNRLKAIGRGEENPIASNDTPEGRAKNRRIEFVRINK